MQNSWPSGISFLWPQKLIRTHNCQSEMCQIPGPSQRKVFNYFKKNWIFNVIGLFLQNCYLIVKTPNRIPDQLCFMMFFSLTTIYSKKWRNVQNALCILAIAYLMQFFWPSDILDTRPHLQIWMLQIGFCLHLHTGRSYWMFLWIIVNEKYGITDSPANLLTFMKKIDSP